LTHESGSRYFTYVSEGNHKNIPGIVELRFYLEVDECV